MSQSWTDMLHANRRYAGSESVETIIYKTTRIVGGGIVGLVGGIAIASSIASQRPWGGVGNQAEILAIGGGSAVVGVSLVRM